MRGDDARTTARVVRGVVAAAVVTTGIIALVALIASGGEGADGSGGSERVPPPPATVAEPEVDPSAPSIAPPTLDASGSDRPEPSWAADLRTLRVAEPSPRDGYRRELFEHWILADANRCSTRCEVLLRDFRQDVTGAPVGGWLSLYDGLVVTDSSDLDVDHVVALSEAWVSGADTWSPGRRRDFANDLSPGALLAVSASVNRSKGDRDPAEWQPPDPNAWCTYAADWIGTKNRWGLSADPLEFTTLSEMLAGCG